MKKTQDAARHSIVMIADVLQNFVAFESQVDIPWNIVNECLQEVTSFLALEQDWASDFSGPCWQPFGQKSFLELLIDECAVCVKFTVYIMGLPRDFLSGLPKQMFERRLRSVDVFCIRSWILFYRIIKQILADEDQDKSEDLKEIQSLAAAPEILKFIHSILGDLNMCSADEGRT